jgi:NAD(P)-dependent dehydrogenase (short-subunit alcohol dehydrogenase family)
MSTPDGPVAVVTGAAGELGTAILRRLSADGYRLVGLERTPELADQVRDRFPPASIETFAADQTDPEAVRDAFTQIASRIGPPHLVVANAGYAKFGALLTMPVKTFRRHIDVNLVGTFAVCQAAAQAMAAASAPGCLVVISSNLALIHSDQVSAYTTSKAALQPLIRGLAAELGVYGIRANCVLPGVLETAMTAPMLTQPGVRDDLIAETPLSRLGTPGDVADTVAFLASPAAAWLTGASIVLDGGQSIYGQPRWLRQDRTTPDHPRWEPALGDRTNRTLLEEPHA